MNNDAAAQAERRHSPRISPKGSVVVHDGGVAHRGRVGNLGRGGLLVHATLSGGDASIGREVEVELRLDHGHSEWLRLVGRVLRLGDGALAIELTSAPADFVRMIDDSATASHRHRRVMSVVLVDARLERRQQIGEAFRAAGCLVVDAATPLEVIVRLGESAFEPDLIVIAQSLPSSIANELHAWARRAHPRAKLVTVGDHVEEPEGLAHWLSSADPGDDLLARVRELLMRPRP